MFTMLLALLLSLCAAQTDEWRAPTVSELMTRLRADTDNGYPNLSLQTDFGIIGAPAVEPLITFLKTPGHTGKRTACSSLGEIGDRRAVAPLILMLSDTDSGVRSAAAWALGIIRDRRAVLPLTKALDDPDGRVEWAAEDALASIGDRRASDALMRAVESKSFVSNFAARALGVLREERAIPLLTSALGAGRARGWGSEGLGLSDLGDNAAQALSQIGKVCAPDVIKALDSDDDLVRIRAMGVLTNIRDQRASGRLYEMFLNSQQVEVQERAAGALAALRDRRIVPQLLTWLEDPDPNGQVGTAIRCLGSLSDPRAVEPLTRLALSGNTRVREEAIAALGRVHSASSYSALLHLTAAYPRNIRSAALSALGAQRDPRAFDFLMNVMKTSELTSDRSDAATAVGTYGDARAIPALLERARIAPDDRPNLLIAIGQLGTPGFQALRTLLKTSHGNLLLDAEAAVARCGKRAIKPLLELANGPDRAIAYLARRDVLLLEKRR
jgi:HEAT repeat protein